MLLPLLRSIEAISACRDRDRLPRALFRAAQALLGESADIGIYSRAAQGESVLRLSAGPTRRHSADALWPAIIDDLRCDGKLLTRSIEGRYCGALLLYASELASDRTILAFAVDQADLAGQAETLASLACIHDDQLKLLDYSELDTLTRLLNRKTFDETFDRLLTCAIAATPDDGFDDRQQLAAGSQAWLCVIDIDHFKRVNDSFGHLFGDQVLLRMGDLMRKTFRGGDRLFRFGGEEFVVILNAESEDLAAASFTRFRKAVEQHEFPQVGKVSCSIGFTAVAASDLPTDVVGRADQALYYAKEHGRNQVRCHERLLLEGAIAKPTATAAPLAEDLDGCALFG